MAEILTHNFVSPKADSPDSSLVSATEWNDGHIFSGGSAGKLLIYDATQPKHVRWVPGVSSSQNGYSQSGSFPTPANFPLGSLVITEKVMAMFGFTFFAVTVGNVGGNAVLLLNGIGQHAGLGFTSGNTVSASVVITLAPNTYVVAANAITAGAAAITTVDTRYSVLLIGMF